MDSVARMKELVRGHASVRVEQALAMLKSAVRLEVKVSQFDREHRAARQEGYVSGLNDGIDLVENYFVHPLLSEVERLKSPAYMITDGDLEQFIQLCRDCKTRLTNEVKHAVSVAEVPQD